MAKTDIKTMNVWDKLLNIRLDFLKENVTKSGINPHAEFKYFELEDIVPPALKLFNKYNCIFLINFPEDKATGTLVNLDNTEQQIVFEFKVHSISEPAKFRMNETQALGAEITYMRRYLYFLMLDMVEHDEFDKNSGADNVKNTNKKPASTQERHKIKNELTNKDGAAEELQIEALKMALKTLKELDPEQEEFIQQIVIKTERFTKLTKTTCDELIKKLSQMIDSYDKEEKE